MNNYCLIAILTICSCFGILQVANADVFVGVYSDDPFIIKGDKITIGGHVTRINYEIPVTIQVAHNGNLILVKQTDILFDGTFSYEITTKGPLWDEDGIYTVKAFYGGEKAESFFDFHASTVKVSETQPETTTAESDVKEELPKEATTLTEPVEKTTADEKVTESSSKTGYPDMSIITVVVIAVLIIGVALGIHKKLKAKSRKIIETKATPQVRIDSVLTKQTSPISITDESILQTGVSIPQSVQKKDDEVKKITEPTKTENTVLGNTESQYTDADYENAIADEFELRILWVLHREKGKHYNRNQLYRSFKEDVDRSKKFNNAMEDLIELGLVKKTDKKEFNNKIKETFKPDPTILGKELIKKARNRKITKWDIFLNEFKDELGSNS